MSTVFGSASQDTLAVAGAGRCRSNYRLTSITSQAAVPAYSSPLPCRIAWGNSSRCSSCPIHPYSGWKTAGPDCPIRMLSCERSQSPRSAFMRMEGASRRVVCLTVGERAAHRNGANLEYVESIAHHRNSLHGRVQHRMVDLDAPIGTVLPARGIRPLHPFGLLDASTSERSSIAS